jgi:hypothetical protein
MIRYDNFDERLGLGGRLWDNLEEEFIVLKGR